MSRRLHSIGLVSGLTMVSRVLGLVRDSLIAAAFGTSALASAFVTAFTLPNLFRRLLGEGALTAALVPTLNDELERGQRPAAYRLLNQTASWLSLATLVIVVLAMAVLSLAGSWGAWAQARGMNGETVERWVLAARLAVVLFPYLIFVCLAAALSAVLQTLDNFLAPALTPVWLNFAIIAGLGGAMLWGGGDESQRMAWLCGGVLLGGAAQMIGPTLAMMREGWHPAVDLSLSEPVRAILRLMGPTVLGSAIYLINLAVSRFIGLSLNESAAAVLNLASRLMELPIGVFAVAVSTVIFPLVSRYAAAQDWDNLGLAYRRGMRLILLINVPAAVGLTVLAKPIIGLLFQRGEFSAEDTALVAPVLGIYAFGLPFYSFVNLVLRAYFAQKDTKTPVAAAALSFGLNIGLSLVLMQVWGTVGLAIAANIAVVGQTIFLQLRLSRKRPGFEMHHLWLDLAKIALAATGMGLALGAGLASLGGWWPHSLLGQAGMLGVFIGTGAILYAGLAWMLRVEGRTEVMGLLRRARR